MVCIQLPGKNKLFFRNITEEKVEPLLNGVFHNDIHEEDLVGQSGSKGFGMWAGIGFIEDLPFFARQKRIILNNCGCYDPEKYRKSIFQEEVTGTFFKKQSETIPMKRYCTIIEKERFEGPQRRWFTALDSNGKNALNTVFRFKIPSSAMPRRATQVHLLTGQYLKAIHTG